MQKKKFKHLEINTTKSNRATQKTTNTRIATKSIGHKMNKQQQNKQTKHNNTNTNEYLQTHEKTIERDI